jgi:hypothetical protein
LPDLYWARSGKTCLTVDTNISIAALTFEVDSALIPAEFISIFSLLNHSLLLFIFENLVLWAWILY